MKVMLLSHFGERNTLNYVRINDLTLIQAFISLYIVFIGFKRSAKLEALFTLLELTCCYIAISFDSI